jgi:hypothetical protein
MIARVLFGLVAAGLLLAYLAPVMLKLGETALGMVMLAGVVLMLVDLWHSLRDSPRQR